MFSLCSQQLPMLKGEWEDHKPLSNAEMERKALVACRKGHNRALGQSESQLLLPARHLSFHGGNLSHLVT